MESSEGKIKAHFAVSHGAVTIRATFHEVAVVIRWPRTSDPGLTSRHIRTLLLNLPDVVRDGLDEVYIQDQAKQIDAELRDLFKKDEQ